MKHRQLVLRTVKAAAWLLFGVATAFAAPDAREIIRKLDALVTIPVSEWKYQVVPIEGAERPDLDDKSWPGTRPGGTDPRRPRWLRTTITLPEFSSGYELTGGRAELQMEIGGEAVIYVNGSKGMPTADAPVNILLSEAIKAGQKFVIAIELIPEAGSDAGLDEAVLKVTPPSSRPSVHDLVRDLEVIGIFLQGDPQRAAQYGAAFAAALAKLDFAALDQRDQPRFDSSLRTAREALPPLENELKAYTIRFTGQSHLDMAWLWPWVETVEVVRRTFRTALQLMQRNPEFTYTQSQAAAYAWVEEKYPALFEEIKERVKQGRWEIVGGMWVEPDLNLPDGESLVRQFLVGKRYFREKFGVDVRTGWNPDTFGYNWQMPQICRKSGIDFFVTTKLARNDTNRFPYRLFWWQAPDGSRVLTYFPNMVGEGANPPYMMETLMAIGPPSGAKEVMYLYGVGDHGGGPTQENIDGARRLQQEKLFPNLKFGSAQPYLDGLLEKSRELNIPVWNDELYFEYHRGVYTTQARTKLGNRKSEVLLLNAEKFSSLAQLFGQPYPQPDLNEAWKTLLFNQFHDILPGSSIAPVYVDNARDYRQIGRVGGDVLEDSLAHLAARIKTAGPGIALVVFNPLAWERTEVVEAEVQLPGVAAAFHVTDEGGRPALHQVVEREGRLNRVKFVFVAAGVPSLGYKTFRVIPARFVAPPGKALPPTPLKVDAQALTLENEYVKLKVGPASGLIESLYDKTNGREVLDQTRRGNLLQTFVDKPKAWDAWNLDADYEDQKWDLATADAVEVVETGPVRATVRVIKHFHNSRFVQDLVLYPKMARVDCNMEVDWHEKHILLKAAFPVSVSSRTATYEIPFGAIGRPTTRETSLERAKFEVPALRWADLSDAHYGVSILNESKYGYDTKGNVIRLSLLRSTAWPDPHADEGVHHFTYAIYPHPGSWEQAKTARRAYELNYPLLVRVEPHHGGELPASNSFVAIDSPSAYLTAMKKAEDDGSIILRFYKLGGDAEQVTVTLPKAVAEAVETDLMEREISPLAVQGTRVSVPVKPYEIKTVRVKFQ